MPDDLPALSSSSAGRPDAPPWHEWGPEAFRLARVSARPILLVVTRGGDPAGDPLYAALADPRLAVLAGTRFVAVRVDADERPDVAVRYGPAPALLALTPDGEPFDRAAPDPEAALTLVTSALARWDGDRADVLSEAETARITRAAASAAASHRRPTTALTPAVLDIVIEAMEADGAPDPGAGIAGVARLWRYAHHRRRTPGALGRARALAERALRRAALPDAACRAGDLGDALLAISELAREDLTFAETSREEVAAAVAFLDAALGDSAGGFRHALPPAGAPVFASACARAARGLIEAGAAFGRRDWTARGLRAIEFIADRMRAGEAGVYHAWDGDARGLGLLDDQVQALLTLLTAYEVSGASTYFEHARHLARALERGWWERGHGFLDVASGHDETGLLAEPVIPFASNVDAAEACLWLARLTHDDRFMDLATETLAAVSPGFEGRRVAAAAFARVVDRVLTAEPEVKVVAEFPVGEPDRVVDPLHRAALRLPAAARTVQRLSLATDIELMRNLGLPVERPRVAYVCAGRDCSPPITDAEAMVAAAAALTGFGDAFEDDEDVD